MLNIREAAYELYVQDWVDTHTTPEERLASIREYYDYACECESSGETYPAYYDAWLTENGYNGQVYACFDEFLTAEYQDVNYMTSLLANNQTLLSLYLKDVA